MEFEQAIKDSYIIDMDDADGVEKSSGRPVASVYLAKINSSFVDPSLELRLDVAKKTLTRLTKEKLHLSTLIENLKTKIKSVKADMRQQLPYTVQYAVQNQNWTINLLRGWLEKYFPDSINEDPEDVPDPEIEEAYYNKRTRELTHALTHRTKNLAEEKRMIKEFEHLNETKEKLDREVKESGANLPSGYDSWGHGTKYDLYRRLRVALKELKECEKQEKAAKKPYERRSAEHKEKIELLVMKSQLVEQEIKRVETNILELQLQRKKQASLNNKYCKLVKKADQFAKQGDFVALEELIHKEVEDFTCRWSSDEAFRANYTRSIQLSLANQGLSNDGRMQDCSE